MAPGGKRKGSTSSPESVGGPSLPIPTSESNGLVSESMQTNRTGGKRKGSTSSPESAGGPSLQIPTSESHGLVSESMQTNRTDDLAKRVQVWLVILWIREVSKAGWVPSCCWDVFFGVGYALRLVGKEGDSVLGMT
ncbi:hypothetical protein EZV62_018785 [Acer yangbiense]|uniref:Uncharacterized protein n=1 Tax=Acer yangbiense TaxID=1000413 RepID=A0A5C7H9U1_9ROSI|nr:hypothetical protein EZV62_018785 [Acer yangbiense]